MNKILGALKIFGIDLQTTTQSLRGLLPYVSDLRKFRDLYSQSEIKGGKISLQPCLHDRYEKSGVATGHYFHQDHLVARRIYTQNPLEHADVGSRIDGFVAHVASYRKICVFDIRPLVAKVANIEFIQADLTAPVPNAYAERFDSVSCLHALEHFGLGRYGDKVDPDGYRIGFNRISELVRPGGIFYFSVPIGTEKICFNAHRIFSVSSCLNLFQDNFILESFSYVDDLGDLHEDVAFDKTAVKENFGLRHGCGIFCLRKREKLPQSGIAPESKWQ